jgi:putative CocE/NonD family hydrolase
MGDPFFNHVYPQGVFALTHVRAIAQCEQYAGLSAPAELPDDWRTRLSHLPVIDLDREVFGRRNDQWREHLQHPVCDAYWERTDVLEGLEDVDIPVFLQGGWFDFGGIGTKQAYAHLSRSDSPHLRLLIGPWLHSGRVPPGETFDWGPDAGRDPMPTFLRWFDAWLRGTDDNLRHEPPVQVFAIGPNRWLEAETYPLPRTSWIKFFLGSGGSASIRSGRGRLSLQQPADGPAFDSYVYDPGDPTPSLWYERLASYESAISDRDDLLIYESDPLAESIMVMGPITAHLHAASSARDTDWIVYWRIIDEEGRMLPMGRGMLRARFRKSASEPRFLVEDQVYEYAIDLWHMGIRIDRGWRIRLEIASACFPSLSRNLNTGGRNEMDVEFVSARQRVFHSPEHPSHLALPVIDLDEYR